MAVTASAMRFMHLCGIDIVNNFIQISLAFFVFAYFIQGKYRHVVAVNDKVRGLLLVAQISTIFPDLDGMLNISFMNIGSCF